MLFCAEDISSFVMLFEMIYSLNAENTCIVYNGFHLQEKSGHCVNCHIILTQPNLRQVFVKGESVGGEHKGETICCISSSDRYRQ